MFDRQDLQVHGKPHFELQDFKGFQVCRLVLGSVGPVDGSSDVFPQVMLILPRIFLGVLEEEKCQGVNILVDLKIVVEGHFIAGSTDKLFPQQ